MYKKGCRENKKCQTETAPAEINDNHLGWVYNRNRKENSPLRERVMYHHWCHLQGVLGTSVDQADSGKRGDLGAGSTGVSGIVGV